MHLSFFVFGCALLRELKNYIVETKERVEEQLIVPNISMSGT